MINVRSRQCYIFFAVVSFLLCVATGEIYRPWAYLNSFNHLGLADSGTSYFGSMTAVFYANIINPSRIYLVNIASALIGCVIYECLQQMLGLGIFDIKDIFAILLGVVTATVIILFIRYNTFERLQVNDLGG